MQITLVLLTPARPSSACAVLMGAWALDGEAVACDDSGVASFDRVRYRRRDEDIFLYSFDLIELNGDDLRRDPLEGRKTKLEMMLAKAGRGIPVQRAHRQ